MFISREALETGTGTAPLGLRLARGAARPSPAAPQGWLARSARRLGLLRLQWELRLAGIDWTPDLAENIGSARWFRGFGTLLGLSVFALEFLPDFSAIGAPAPKPVDAASHDEFRNPAANVPERAAIKLTATFAEGDNLTGLLRRAGVSVVEGGRSTI